jgi:hypothetical protein
VRNAGPIRVARQSLYRYFGCACPKRVSELQVEVRWELLNPKEVERLNEWIKGKDFDCVIKNIES